MLQLYKKRNFSDYINDTFLFFRIHGKHFFKLYFIINGAFLLIASALIYFIFKVYFEYVFSSISGGAIEQQNNSLGNLFANNSGGIIAVVVFGILFLLFISLIQFAFPIFYLDLLDKKNGTHFTAGDIINKLKVNAFKLFKFIIGSLFIIFPFVVIIVTLNVLLCFIIIGFPLFLITFPFIMIWIHLTFYHYITSDYRFFASISAAFNDLKQQFWVVVLNTLVMYFIIQVVNTIFTMIPYVFGIASIFTTIQNPNESDNGLSTFSIIMTIVMVVSFIISYILNNLLLINGGLVYYTSKELNESVSSTNSIDLIGSDSE